VVVRPGSTRHAELIHPRFNRSEIFGFVAGFGTTFAAVPDLVAMFRRKSSAGMNPRMQQSLASFRSSGSTMPVDFFAPGIAWNVVAVLSTS